MIDLEMPRERGVDDMPGRFAGLGAALLDRAPQPLGQVKFDFVMHVQSVPDIAPLWNGAAAGDALDSFSDPKEND